jgi:hypothetical protein
MKRQYPEDDLAISVKDFLDVALPPEIVWFHVPNGGKRNVREAARFKAMGVLAGVADDVFIMPDAKVGFIELKVGSNTQEDSQKVFETNVTALGCPYVVCRSVHDVQVTLEDWGVQLKGRVAA